MDSHDFEFSGRVLDRIMADLARFKVRKKHMTVTEAGAWEEETLSHKHKRGLVGHFRNCKACRDRLRSYLSACKFWDTPEGQERIKALQMKLRFVLHGVEQSSQNKALGQKKRPGKVIKIADRKRGSHRSK